MPSGLLSPCLFLLPDLFAILSTAFRFCFLNTFFGIFNVDDTVAIPKLLSGTGQSLPDLENVNLPLLIFEISLVGTKACFVHGTWSCCKFVIFCH